MVLNHNENEIEKALGMTEKEIVEAMKKGAKKLIKDREMPSEEERAAIIFLSYCISSGLYQEFLKVSGVTVHETITEDIEEALSKDIPLENYSGLVIIIIGVIDQSVN